MTTSNLHKWATLPDPTSADLARAAAGDVDSFALIVERYQGMVYSVAYNVLGNHTDAEDAAQEAFLRCYRKLPQYRGEATFSTWLFRLALNASVDYQRRERRFGRISK
jgi:RNA polymerase sigma-70 factor (ECF subfamily)